MPKLIHSPQPHSGERRNPDEFSAHSYIQSWHKHSRSLAEDHATLQRMGLVFDFFSAFSRAEYALKVTGYKKKGRNGDNAQADWTSFAKDVAKLLPTGSDQELTVAKEYLLNPNSAPKKQQINNGSLKWETVSPTCQIKTPTDEEKESDILLLYVRRIRNNLFHGGKSSITESPVRNEELLKHGLIVLLACINSIDKVRNAYCDICDAFVPCPPP